VAVSTFKGKSQNNSIRDVKVQKLLTVYQYIAGENSSNNKSFVVKLHKKSILYVVIIYIASN
jgi:hypothetical protein